MSVGQVYPELYQQQLEQKTTEIAKQIHLHGLVFPSPEVFESKPSHYRMRAEFRVWHEQNDSFYIMFDPNTKEKVRIDEFPVGSQRINELMVSLRQHFLANKQLRHKLYQVEFLTTSTNEALVTMIYHKVLDDEWAEHARSVATQLNIKLIGRSRKQKVLLSDNWVEECFHVTGRDYRYRQVENTFTQPNAGVCVDMLNWACTQAADCTGDLLELYCGNGNFTLPLAAKFPNVLATEISKNSIKTAIENALQNNINNVSFFKASSEEFSSAWLKKDARLHQKMNLDNYKLETLFVDPPRAGLDPDTIELARNFKHIIYISCNPQTLIDNIANLSDNFVVSSFALFDQFPYTHHMECGVLLTRR
ncbi:tRNA (uridine(54)-C5)-methyltransferase TrmA [Gynuella sp.]|uniref:tRNA (uridine(54)-C5)-methyltransferase TrmA n=1 Tax=Gynuella sp. TaxID=2969146 RepID=UPI003D09F526